MLMMRSNWQLQSQPKVFEGIEMTAEVQDVLLKNIQRRLTPQPVKLRSDIEVTCYSYEGIEAIKEALLAGQAKGTKDIPVKIRLVAPPLYVMTTVAYDKDQGKEILNSAIAAIQEKLAVKQGNLVIKLEPTTVSEKDDKNLSAMMAELERKNMEVSGDDDASDEDADIDELSGGKPKPKPKSKEEEEDEDEDDDDEDDDEEEGEK
eukprot:TRINITY_DN2950_c0_g1_i2.p2 TRINITY_DN2950_c0_g1~~TRINITY_DN2950_c0_g1_i2.p2  ORF type:complete len:205 (+),score=94.16 TRINITY_DN2950_c0_g1_i2:574-1188(+)